MNIFITNYNFAYHKPALRPDKFRDLDISEGTGENKVFRVPPGVCYSPPDFLFLNRRLGNKSRCSCLIIGLLKRNNTNNVLSLVSSFI
jgi:hypothetical protein